MEPYLKTEVNMNLDLLVRLKQFMDEEAKSGSMDYGCITPLYVYRMWGGQVPLDEIEEAFKCQDSRLGI